MFATPEKMATLVNAWRHSLSAAATSGLAERKGAGILIMSLTQWMQKNPGALAAGADRRERGLNVRGLMRDRGAMGASHRPAGGW